LAFAAEEQNGAKNESGRRTKRDNCNVRAKQKQKNIEQNHSNLGVSALRVGRQRVALCSARRELRRSGSRF